VKMAALNCDRVVLAWGRIESPGPHSWYEPFTEWSQREDPGDASILVFSSVRQRSALLKICPNII